MAIIVFQHSDAGRPGRLGMTLRDHAHRLDIRRPDLGDPIPPDFDDVEAVIALGGPQNVGDTAEWMRHEMEYLRAAHDRALPVVGVCLGAQMLAAALGGDVAAMKRPVVGFRRVSINPVGQVDPVLVGLAWDSMQFCTHARHIAKTPPGVAVLAGSDYCAAQIFRAGLRTYGFQFHCEADRAIIGALLHESPDMLTEAGVTEAEIDREAEKHYATFARLADRLCVNIATFLVPSDTRVAV